MKNRLLLLILSALPYVLISQTLELEEEYLNKVIQSGKLSHEELKEIGKSWNKLLKEFGGYPELPYNTKTQKIEFIKIDNFQGILKKDIYKKVKEWIAINYGAINSVLHYEDYDSGKIIVKGWNKFYIDDIFKNFWGNPKDVIRSLKCYHTVIFTIKDGKMKTEYTNLEYESESGGYTIGTTYVPLSKINYNIQELYPVTKKEKSTWISRLSTLKNTVVEIKNIQESIKYFVLSVKDDQKF